MITVNDAYSDPRFFHGVDDDTGYRTRNMLALPLAGADGEIIGAFEILNKRVGKYTAEDTEIALSLGANAALAIQNALMIGELRRHRATLETENRNLLREIGGRLPAQSLLGMSAPIEALRTMITRVADADVTILITGESGTGKDLVARSVHYASPRARGPFVALNCAALPETLVETELFGVEKGVATGVDRRMGKFEAAHGGTLFLDEIGELAAARAGQNPACLAGTLRGATGRPQPYSCGRADRSRDEQGRGERHRKRAVPGRPVLSPERGSAAYAFAARDPRRPAIAGRVFPERSLARNETAASRAVLRRACRGAGLLLAWQRAATAKRDAPRSGLLARALD